MSIYWKDFRGDDPDLWEHEWNKHGTCISTLETRCYSPDSYYPQEEVVDYFDKTVEKFQELPSYEFLAKAGILPSYTQTYSLSSVKEALERGHGAEVTVRCHYNSLNEIWYHYNVAGSLQTGKFVPSIPGTFFFFFVYPFWCNCLPSKNLTYDLLTRFTLLFIRRPQIELSL